jgi:hypothetical protein
MIREHYSHAIADLNKTRKRNEASERQVLRDNRTNKQQLAKLDVGGFIAKKERAKLES